MQNATPTECNVIQKFVFIAEHRRRKGRRMVAAGWVDAGQRQLLRAEELFIEAGEMFLAQPVADCNTQ